MNEIDIRPFIRQQEHQIALLVAEVERLKASLEDIAGQCKSDFIPCTQCETGIELEGCYIQDTAEKALQPSPLVEALVRRDEAAMAYCESFLPFGHGKGISFNGSNARLLEAYEEAQAAVDKLMGEGV